MAHSLPHKKSSPVAIWAVVGSLCSLQVGSSLAKQVFAQVGGAGATGLRAFCAALILCAIWRPFRSAIPRAAIKDIIAYGTAMGVMNLAFYLAIERIPLGIAIALDFLGPLVVILFKSRRPRDFVWGLCAGIGVFLLLPLVQTSEPLDGVGIALAMLSGTCWVGYILFGKRASEHMTGGRVIALGMSVAALVTLPIGIWHAGNRLLDGRVLLINLAVAVASSAIPYSLEMFALSRLTSLTFSTLMSAEPAIGSLVGWLVLGERLTLLQALAIGLIAIAAAGAARGERAAQSAESQLTGQPVA